MADFRKKLLGLAGASLIFSGMAYGQVASCSTLTATPSFIRAEGQTELLPPLTLTCTSTGAATLNISVFITPGVTITSKLLNSSTGATEATAAANGGGATPSVEGTVTGSSITFTGITLTATSTTVTITNIRINATGVPTTVGAPPTTISAQAFVGGTGVTPGANTNTNPAVAFALNGLGTVKLFKDAPNAMAGINTSTFGVCGSLNAQSGSTPAPTPQFYVQINEGFQNAFKNAADEASTTIIPAAGSSSSNAVNSGTRIKLVFGNVPTNLQLYVPVSVITGLAAASPPVAPDGAVLTLTSSETGSLSAVSAISGQSNISSLPGSALLTNSGGTATAIYEVTTDNVNAVDLFSIPVFAIAGSNSVSPQTSPMTLSVSFAPITAATTVPSFAVGSSTSAINTISFVVCQTTLLFPFVTNAAGFETGIAISNTSKDPLTSGGAKAQSGTCTLNFYGQGGTNPTSGLAPNTNTGTGDGAGLAYQSGESYAFTLTSALSTISATNPATFTGYMIAQCSFQYAHAFAYITYGFPGTSSDTMGYLALVLNRGSNIVSDTVGQ